MHAPLHVPAPAPQTATHASCFTFRTMEEAYQLSGLLAKHFPDPAAAHHGLCELLTNAIEHGNLGIGFEEKTQLMRSGRWTEEIARRLASARWSGRVAEAVLETERDEVAVIIRDEGYGFHWEPFLILAPERVQLPNGRGIATARLFAFDRLEYRHGGCEVRAAQKKRGH
jgi:hypothetical protein